MRAFISTLADRHGPQGWWPVQSERSFFVSRDDPRRQRGYHPGEFDFPRTARGRWEIVTGAVLTQNTAWTNVELALGELRRARVTSPRAVLRCPTERLAALIRSAGYFNQKSRYLQAVAEWFVAHDAKLSRSEKDAQRVREVRHELLAVRGVGPETADSILLYAYGLPTFVIDAYTRRVLGAVGLVDAHAPYERLREQLMQSLGEPTTPQTVRSWQEIHALLVEEAKQLRAKPATSAPRQRTARGR